MLAIVSNIGADIFDSLVALGFDAGKSGIKKKYDQHKLKIALKEYIETHSEMREADSLDKEIDYQGLVDYIKDNFLEDVSTRIFDVNKKNRGEARSIIVSHAIAYCKAETEPAKKRVTDFVCGCLDIYKNFFKKDIPAEVYIITAEAVDAVNTHIDEAKYELSAQISEVDSTVENAAVYSLEAIDKDASNGDFGSIGKKMASQLSVASIHHPLFPYYGFDYQNGRLVSKPANPEASKKYPERYELKGKGHIDGHVFKTWQEMASFSYRHQTPITVNVESLKKFLGNVEDPAPQPDINDIKDRTVYAYPPKFPPAFPCSIKVDNETFFDYVLLRTQEIQDDGTYVISNKEQKNSPLFVELKFRRINPEHATGTTNFRFDLNNAKHKDYLQYARFIDATAVASSDSQSFINRSSAQKASEKSYV